MRLQLFLSIVTAAPLVLEVYWHPLAIEDPNATAGMLPVTLDEAPE
jgi:hypothetical protein